MSVLRRFSGESPPAGESGGEFIHSSNPNPPWDFVGRAILIGACEIPAGEEIPISFPE
jgi:hypothetical protein